MVGFELKHNSIHVALRNPNNAVTLQVLEEIQEKSRLTVTPYLCSTSSLEHGWERYQDIIDSKAKTKGVFDIDPEEIASFIRQINTKDDVAKLMTKVKGVDNARRVTETLELAFAGAVSLKSSDIHIEPEENAIRLRYRLDGILSDIYDIDRYIYERIMSRLKLLSGMVLNQRTQAQDGRFTFMAGDREIEIRSSVIPGASGESIVMRILDPSIATFRLENIDLSPKLREALVAEIKKPNGLIVTTGPTGSGKTTVLYACLQEAHTAGVKIITIENPVEYKLEGIVQTQTSEDYTFASGLRAVLRQDPDIIMVGEIRDKEVAETALHAAQTGHLVFSTLHTNSAAAAFTRLTDLGVDIRTLGSALNVFLGQRLVRRLCTECRVTYEATDAEFETLKQVMANHPEPQTLQKPLTLYKPVGCPVCKNTGYKGRSGIFEAIFMDQAVEEVIIRDPREHLIIEAAKPQGIANMVEDGAEKVLRGDTSYAELARVIEMPKIVATTPTNGTDTDDAFLAHVV
ncbi:MAG: GspE/PulE family protein [Candidatus Paceibacterota bacterium]